MKGSDSTPPSPPSPSARRPDADADARRLRQIPAATAYVGLSGLPRLCRQPLFAHRRRLQQTMLSTSSPRALTRLRARTLIDKPSPPPERGVHSITDHTPINPRRPAFSPFPPPRRTRPRSAGSGASLLRSRTGRLSDNIAPPAEVSLFNHRHRRGRGGGTGERRAGRRHCHRRGGRVRRNAADDQGRRRRRRHGPRRTQRSRACCSLGAGVRSRAPSSCRILTCRAFRIRAAIGKVKAAADIPFVCGE